MSKTFPMVPLGEVLTPYQEYINELQPKSYTKLSVKLYGKGVVLDAPADGSSLKMQRHQIAKSGQVILSEIWGKKGAIGIVPSEGDQALCTSHFFLFDICQEKIETKYLQAIFTANYLQEQLDNEAKGTTGYAAVRPKHLLSAKIPVPSLIEQKRIVARIEEFVAKIEKAQILHQKAIQEIEIFKESSAQRLFFGYDKISLPLKDLVTVSGGGTPSKSNPFFWEGTIPWISPKDMKVRDISDAIDHISEKAIVESSAKLIDPGAVLIVVRGMILAHTVPSAVLRVPATINQDMKALIPNKKLLPEYLRSGLWALNRELLNLVEKSTHDTRKLETSKLLTWKIAVPPISEQQRIVTYLEALESQVDTLKRIQAETSTKLDAILPSVLDKAFKGEL